MDPVQLPPSHRGLILTDKHGIIQSCNMTAKHIMSSDTLVGRPIKLYAEKLHAEDGRLDKLDETLMITFGSGTLKNDLEQIFNQIDLKIFAFDLDGNTLYSNHAFSIAFPHQEKNIYSLFKNAQIALPALNVIKHARQSISTLINDGETNQIIQLTPIFSDSNQITFFMGTITEENNTQTLNHKIKQLQSEINQTKSKSHEHICATGKPFLQFNSPSMKELNALISNLVNKDITILILGPSGTGKSTFAKKIHDESLRNTKPFVTINCSALPENLIESELFGYEKGAFTGALTTGKKGLIEVANGGTLFIDEIGELPLYLQGKLLELLQDRTYRPVGSTEVKKADVRIIVATNKDLYRQVEEKSFRKDLYYRIAVAVINIPPLSEHPEDIIDLINLYSLHFNKKYELQVQFTREVKEMLCTYEWPGNIRELEHFIEFLTVRSYDGKVEKKDLPLEIIRHYETVKNAKSSTNTTALSISPHHLSHYEDSSLIDNLSLSYDEHLDRINSVLIKTYYDTFKSSYKVAEKLKISQSKAHRLIQKYCSK
ncbi:MAG: sigma 54-interacting transcriptional regulator [Firmicutes bacterium]|nr:sigma 54-interacting transcriptional regulator [Bacillota bacterium]